MDKSNAKDVMMVNKAMGWEKAPQVGEEMILQHAFLRHLAQNQAQTTEVHSLTLDPGALPQELLAVLQQGCEVAKLPEYEFGEIDVGEAGNLLEELGQDNSPEAVQKFVTWLDEDRSGKVEFQEFLFWLYCIDCIDC